MRINQGKKERYTKENTFKCVLFLFAKSAKERSSLADMEEDFRVIDNYLMVRMPEEVDHHKAVYISEKADQYIMKEGIGNVVFDFEQTHFMDSSGIGVIIGRYKKISYFGGKVFAVNADTRIKRTMMICGLHKVIEIMD